MTRINRAAWKRIKERVAAYVPITMTYDWLSEPTNPLDDIRLLLERSASLGASVVDQHPDETDEEFRRRIVERFADQRPPTDEERFRP